MRLPVILFLPLFLVFNPLLSAQKPEFGLGLGASHSFISATSSSPGQDDFTLNTETGFGFSLLIAGRLELARRFHLATYPAIHFQEQRLELTRNRNQQTVLHGYHGLAVSIPLRLEYTFGVVNTRPIVSAGIGHFKSMISELEITDFTDNASFTYTEVTAGLVHDYTRFTVRPELSYRRSISKPFTGPGLDGANWSSLELRLLIYGRR